jgi:hypothetical protein
LDELDAIPAENSKITYPAVFYGRGRGIHGTTPFTGIMLKEMLAKYTSVNEINLKTGLIILAGKDGYHASYSFSEIMNRNDQAEFLLVTTPENADGGAFQVYPAADFFSDRAIKSLESIRIVNISQ